MQGFQFTLEVGTTADIVGIDYGVMTSEKLGVFAKQSMITASFNASNGMSVASEEPLFTLKLRASKNVSLEEVLRISSRLTAQEAYGLGDELMNVELAFNNKIISDRARLDQNQPNPICGRDFDRLLPA